jgi:hypothetical protein
MRAYELYDQLYHEVKSIEYWSNDIGIMFEEMKNDPFRYKLALAEFEDIGLNNFIDQYPTPTGNSPPKGTYYVSITVFPKIKPILVMNKDFTKNDNQGSGLDNINATKNKFIGTVWFDSEQEADSFMMAVKLQFGQQYEVR